MIEMTDWICAHALRLGNHSFTIQICSRGIHHPNTHCQTGHGVQTYLDIRAGWWMPCLSKTGLTTASELSQSKMMTMINLGIACPGLSQKHMVLKVYSHQFDPYQWDSQEGRGLTKHYGALQNPGFDPTPRCLLWPQTATSVLRHRGDLGVAAVNINRKRQKE